MVSLEVIKILGKNKEINEIVTTIKGFFFQEEFTTGSHGEVFNYSVTQSIFFSKM